MDQNQSMDSNDQKDNLPSSDPANQNEAGSSASLKRRLGSAFQKKNIPGIALVVVGIAAAVSALTFGSQIVTFLALSPENVPNPFVDEGTLFEDVRSENFDKTHYDENQEGVRLADGELTGTYISKPFDTVDEVDWDIINYEAEEYKGSRAATASAPAAASMSLPLPLLSTDSEDGTFNIQAMSCSYMPGECNQAEGKCPQTTDDGKINGGLVFDGENDAVTIEDVRETRYTEDFTIAFWIKSESTAKPAEYVITKNHTSGKKNWSILLNSAGIQFHAKGYRDYSFQPPRDRWGMPEPLAINEPIMGDSENWHHVAFVRQGDNGIAYLDGVEKTTKPDIFNDVYLWSDKQILLGANRDFDKYFYTGALDDVKIFKKALTSENIQALAAVDELGNEPVPFVHFPLDDQPSSSVFQGCKYLNGSCDGDSCPQISDSIVGTGVRFDGVNDHIVIPDQRTMRTGQDDFTLTMWFRSEKSSKEAEYIFTKNHQSGKGSYAFLLRDRKMSFLMKGYKISDTNFLTSIEAPLVYSIPATEPDIRGDNQWHSLALVREGTKGTMYIDGDIKAQNENLFIQSDDVPTWVWNDKPYVIGSNKSLGDVENNYPFKGDIDQVKIWREALAEDELRDHFGHGPAAETSIRLYARECDNSDCRRETTEWRECTSDPCDISEITNRRYVQYKAEFTTTVANSSKLLKLVEVTHKDNSCKYINEDGDSANACFDCNDNDASNSPGADEDGDGYFECVPQSLSLSFDDIDEETFSGEFVDDSRFHIDARCNIGTSCPSIVDGRAHGGIQFDGNDDVISVHHASGNFDLDGGNTIGIWINAASVDGEPTILSKNGSDGIKLQIRSQRMKMILGNQELDAGVVTPGVWTHFAFSTNGTMIKTYKNGIKQTGKTYTGTMNLSGGPLYIGAERPGLNHFSGIIDEVEVFSTEFEQFTDDQIRGLSGASIPPTVPDNNEGDANANPAALEICNEVDDNGNGLVDEFCDGMPETNRYVEKFFYYTRDPGSLSPVDPEARGAESAVTNSDEDPEVVFFPLDAKKEVTLSQPASIPQGFSTYFVVTYNENGDMLDVVSVGFPEKAVTYYVDQITRQTGSFETDITWDGLVQIWVPMTDETTSAYMFSHDNPEMRLPIDINMQEPEAGTKNQDYTNEPNKETWELFWGLEIPTRLPEDVYSLLVALPHIYLKIDDGDWRGTRKAIEKTASDAARFYGNLQWIGQNVWPVLTGKFDFGGKHWVTARRTTFVETQQQFHPALSEELLRQDYYGYMTMNLSGDFNEFDLTFGAVGIDLVASFFGIINTEAEKMATRDALTRKIMEEEYGKRDWHVNYKKTLVKKDTIGFPEGSYAAAASFAYDRITEEKNTADRKERYLRDSNLEIEFNYDLLAALDAAKNAGEEEDDDEDMSRFTSCNDDGADCRWIAPRLAKPSNQDLSDPRGYRISRYNGYIDTRIKPDDFNSDSMESISNALSSLDSGLLFNPIVARFTYLEALQDMFDDEADCVSHADDEDVTYYVRCSSWAYDHLGYISLIKRLSPYGLVSDLDNDGIPEEPAGSEANNLPWDNCNLRTSAYCQNNANPQFACHNSSQRDSDGDDIGDRCDY
ncbi:LamG domain-containing protein [Patescibacteria group bacterium]